MRSLSTSVRRPANHDSRTNESEILSLRVEAISAAERNLTRKRTIVGLPTTIIFCGAIGTRILLANTPAVLDAPAVDVAPRTLEAVQDVTQPPSNIVRERELSGNPLWGISLASLAATRERPIFSPSRRPHAPPVAAAPQRAEPVKPPAPPAELARPLLALVATVIGDTQSMAVFTDTMTSNTIRLRIEEGYAGWILRSVKSREAILQKDGETAIFALPPRDNVASADTSVMPQRIPLPALRRP
jgi:general secretion pathway protein N